MSSSTIVVCITAIGTSEGPGLVDVKEPPVGTFIQFACGFNQTVSRLASKNAQGLFAKHLLKMIHEPNTHIVNLFVRIRNAVIEESHDKQFPISIENLRDLGHVAIHQVELKRQSFI